MPALHPSNANLIVNSCVGKLDAASGLPGSVPPNWNNQRQFTGVWHDGTTPAALADPDAWPQSTPPLRSVGDLVFANAGSPTWWTVNLFGLEIDRTLNDGNAPVPALSRNELINFADNGNAQADLGPAAAFNPSTGFPSPIGQGRVTRFKARISFETLEQERQVYVDIGTGIHLSILAAAVKVELLVPQGQHFIDRGTVNDAAIGQLFGPGPAMITDVLLGGSCLPCFSPKAGCCSATFTQTVVKTSEGQDLPLAVPIPPAAKEVTIYPLDENALGTPWAFAEGINWITGALLPIPSTFTPATKGAIVYEPGLLRATRVPIPQNSTYIFADPGLVEPGNPIAWNIVWHLEF